MEIAIEVVAKSHLKRAAATRADALNESGGEDAARCSYRGYDAPQTQPTMGGVLKRDTLGDAPATQCRRNDGTNGRVRIECSHGRHGHGNKGRERCVH